jgi:hypothetical protein
MTYNTRAAARSRLGPMSDGAENIDRILLAACAAIWLAALGSAVAATVALVDLARSDPEASNTTSSGTPWLLYTVIGVSALVIVAAIPLLVRARRASLDDPKADRDAAVRPPAGRPQTTSRAAEPQTQKLRSHQPGADPIRSRGGYTAPSSVSTFDASLPPAVDRLWLRCTVAIAGAMGLGLLAVGIATYLMAAGHDTPSWAAYVVAGLVTLGMPAIPWIFLGQLRAVVDTP